MTGALTTLRIEVDGHFHGSSDVPRPWVAQITGIDPRYGLARTFVDQLRDYAGAKRSCAGRLNGVVACFPLRDGNLYEVSRLRGSKSKRYVAREFISIESGEKIQTDPVNALAIAERLSAVPGHDGPTLEHRVRDASGTGLSLVRGLGSPHLLGWVLADGERIYRLRVGELHEVADEQERRLVYVGEHGPAAISQLAAIDLLRGTLLEARHV